MLSGIWNTIKSIAEFFSLLFDFVIDFFKGIAEFVVQIVEVPVIITNGLGSILPAGLVVAILTVVTLVITLRVIGRD